MRSGIAVSVVAHAALIAWGVFSLPSPSALDTSNIEQIPVDFVEMGDLTQMNKGIKTAALVEEVAAPPPAEKPIEDLPPLPRPAPKPEPLPEPPQPPPPAPVPPQPPEPEPDPTPPAPAEAAPPPPAPTPEPEAPPPPETTAVAEQKDVPIPRLRPDRPKPKVAPKPDDTIDMDQITALLDKRKLEQMAAAEPSEEEQQPALGSPTATTTTAKMTVNELDALRARLAECWSPPLGWTDPSEVRVVLMLSLNADGSVSGVPTVLESPQGQYSNAAPESALRAVRRCAPYNLPAEKYDAWKQVKVTFDPREMGGA